MHISAFMSSRPVRAATLSVTGLTLAGLAACGGGGGASATKDVCNKLNTDGRALSKSADSAKTPKDAAAPLQKLADTLDKDAANAADSHLKDSVHKLTAVYRSAAGVATSGDTAKLSGLQRDLTSAGADLTKLCPQITK